MNVVEAYREAAMKYYGLSREEVERCIYAPEDDPGQWAPNSLCVLALDWGYLRLDYYSIDFLEQCFKLSDMAGVGYIECINPAICAVYE